jgi:putative membrane protein
LASDVRVSVRDNVPAVTGLLTVASLALVFGAALRVIPDALLPRAPAPVMAALPHLNAVVSTVAIGTIVAGILSARRGDYRRHRALMLVSLGLFAAFLVVYLYKVIVDGPAPFPGPEGLYATVYLPVLAVHVLLAVVCIPLLYYVALLALTRPLSEVFDTAHARVARVAGSLWLVSFVLGNVVYAMLYLVPW